MTVLGNKDVDMISVDGGKRKLSPLSFVTTSTTTGHGRVDGGQFQLFTIVEISILFSLLQKKCFRKIYIYINKMQKSVYIRK